MEHQQIMLPTHPWNRIRPNIKSIKEDCLGKVDVNCDDYDFLSDFGIIDPINTGQLTETGEAFFNAAFIRCDAIKEQIILQKLLLNFPPTQAIQQYLWGVANVSTEQILTVLKITNFWIFEEKKLLTHFLELLNLAKIIKYDRKNKKIIVLISPNEIKLPPSIYIDPIKPYGNIYWIKKILAECEGYIYWFDKNFTSEALDWIYSIADATKINTIRILSLDMGDQNLSKKAKKNYRRFKEELVTKGIKVEWKTIESTSVRNVHDRWILGDKGFVRNIPDVNTISSGKRSEMVSSENHKDVLSAFLEYWQLGIEVN